MIKIHILLPFILWWIWKPNYSRPTNLQQYFFLSFHSQASVHSLATPIGSFASGPIMDRWGRKPALLLAIVPLLSGWIFLATASSHFLILVGRVVAGISVGLIAAPAQVCLAIYVTITSLLPKSHNKFGFLMNFDLENACCAIAFAVPTNGLARQLSDSRRQSESSPRDNTFSRPEFLFSAFHRVCVVGVFKFGQLILEQARSSFWMMSTRLNLNLIVKHNEWSDSALNWTEYSRFQSNLPRKPGTISHKSQFICVRRRWPAMMTAQVTCVYDNVCSHRSSSHVVRMQYSPRNAKSFDLRDSLFAYGYIPLNTWLPAVRRQRRRKLLLTVNLTLGRE